MVGAKHATVRGVLLLVTALVAAPATAQTARKPDSGAPDIIVRGSRAKPSNWREASTEHLVLLSDGSEQEVTRLARNLERLHFLLCGLFGKPYAPDDKVRIRITLIGDVPEFEAMGLANKRWQQGPYNDLFQASRYYDPREDGAVMATTRVDQRAVIEHTTLNAHSVRSAVEGALSAVNTDPHAGSSAAAQVNLESALVGDFATAGLAGPHDLTVSFGEHAIEVPAESMLYAGYAQHFLQTYFPAAYPRWYLDGFGEIFASLTVKGDDLLDFGQSPKGTGAVLGEFGGYPLKDILDDAYLTQKPSKTRWTPIHAWLLTHFLFFSDTRRPQLNRYLMARAAGQDAASAAAVFGDQKVLARELTAYYGARKPYEEIRYPATRIDEPVVRRLSQGEAAFVKGRLELGSRILIPDAPGPDTPPGEARQMQAIHDRAVRDRDRWLARLRDDAARWSDDLGAQLLLAEAECRSGHPADCLAAADKAIALTPGDSRALAWKGVAMAQAAAAAPPSERPARLAEARTAIASANRSNVGAVEPLLAYYRSFATVGDKPSDNAIDALGAAVAAVPNAPESRLALAGALADRGQTGVAHQVVLPVAIGAYDSPERPAARVLFARTGSAAGEKAVATPQAPPR